MSTVNILKEVYWLSLSEKPARLLQQIFNFNNNKNKRWAREVQNLDVEI